MVIGCVSSYFWEDVYLCYIGPCSLFEVRSSQVGTTFCGRRTSGTTVRPNLPHSHTFNNYLTSDGVMASPVLLRNITQGVSRENDLKIRASPFGSGLPPIPIAKTATLARVPSSVSIDKSLQIPLFAALKHHFLHSRRLVKKGDIIAISIESDGETADLEGGENKIGRAHV